jgi:hypothetical protein
VGANEQARNVEALSYLDGSGHAVAIICESDVHEHEIRPHPPREFDCLFCRCRGADHLMAQVLNYPFHVQRRPKLVVRS